MTVQDPILTTYLAEIAAVPLLTAAEERDLAARSRAGDATARDHLVRATLRYVVSIAKGYRGRGMDFADLISEGNVGLTEAAKLYGPGCGCRFATYAGQAIRRTIKDALIDDPRPIRLPKGIRKLMARVLAHPEVEGTLPGYMRARLAHARRAFAGAATGGETPIETVADRRGGDEPDGAVVDHGAIREKILAAWHVLNQRERAVFARHYGFMRWSPRPVGSIARNLKLPRHTVEARLARAVAKLRREIAGESGAGLPPVRADGKKLDGRARLDPRAVPLVLRMVERGVPDKAIAREFGVSPGAVDRAARKHGRRDGWSARPRSASGLWGVTRQRSGRWQAKFWQGRTAHCLGTFDSKREAGLAYDAAARRLVGPGATLNFPVETTE